MNSDDPPRPLFAVAAAIPLLVFLVVYVPAIGLGFISDDFRWVRESQLAAVADVLRLFSQDNGFYRPLVSLSFGLNRLLAGPEPYLYGLTNLALVGLCAVLLAVLCRRLGLGVGASWLAAAIWALNFHGINMAMLWISGRTALILIASSLAAAIAVVSRAPLAAAVFAACALFAKEEAVMLPAILFCWMLGLGEHKTQPGRRRLVLLIVTQAIALAGYFWLRSRTNAIIPSTAPSFYHLTLEPQLLLRNVAEYADRALSYSIGVTLLAFLVLRRPGSRIQLRSSTAFLALAWYVGGFALTTLVPSRSSLYACFPAVAGAIAAAEMCGHLWRQSDRRRRSVALAAVIAVPVLCAPAYIARNHRWTDLARFSSRVLTYLDARLPALADDTWLVFIDDPADRVNVQSAFGAMLPDAVALRAGRPIKVWVKNTTSPHWNAAPSPCNECPRHTFVIDARDVRVLESSQR